MMLGDIAVSAIYKFLNENSKSIGVERGRIFKYERPKKLAKGDYIVVNHLPFTYRDTINEGVVNMNIHSPYTASSEPNTKGLQAIIKSFLDVFGNEQYLDGAYFELYSDNDDTYYINLKFNVTYNNLKN